MRTFGQFGELKVTGNIPTLAPDLSRTFNPDGTGVPQDISTPAVDTTTGGLIEVMNENGRAVYSAIRINGLSGSTTCSFEMTVDGVLIFQDTVALSSDNFLQVFGGYKRGGGSTIEDNNAIPQFLVESNITIDVETDAGNAVSIQYMSHLIE